jgi:lysozyme
MKASERCITEIKSLEGFTSPAKNLPGDRPEVITGGYGETQGVIEGQAFTEPEADALLRLRLARDFEPPVNASVKVPITQPQFDALISFVYNVGVGAFLRSTLLSKLNTGDYAGAAAEFPKWNKSAGRVQPGLILRRTLEQNWFSQLEQA